MSILRVFHDGAVAPAGETWTLGRDEARHLVRVRRARPGDTVEVLNGRGHRAVATLVAAAGHAATLRTDSVRAEPAVAPRIHLCLALAKAKAFELAVQKTAELGVASVIPVATENCDVGLFGARAIAKVDKWRSIAVESLKQCGNSWLPHIVVPVPFVDALARARSAPGLRIIAALHPRAEPLGTVLARENPTEATVFIGPEGDFTPAEYENAFAAGCVPVTLAETVLRVETAAVAALSVLVQYRLSTSAGIEAT